MKPTIPDKMEDFLTKANLLLKESKKTNCESKKTLSNINRKMNFFIASVLTVMLFMLSIINHTSIEVVQKANASEVSELFVTKTDALKVHKIEEDYFKEMILAYKYGDSTLITNDNSWLIEDILTTTKEIK